MTRPIPKMDPRCPDFLKWLCDEAERQERKASDAVSLTRSKPALRAERQSTPGGSR